MNKTVHQLGIPQHIARRGDTYTIGNATILVLNPSEPLYTEQNSNSIVVNVTYHNVSFMLAGDADEQAEERMLNSTDDLKADVLKLGHHGSRHSTTEPFLDAVSPKVAIISCGYDNPYGHPHNETLQRLIERSITYFRTDIHPELIDDIVATTDGYRLTVTQPSTDKDGALTMDPSSGPSFFSQSSRFASDSQAQQEKGGKQECEEWKSRNQHHLFHLAIWSRSRFPHIHSFLATISTRFLRTQTHRHTLSAETIADQSQRAKMG